MLEIKAPNKLEIVGTSIFLAGSIEMGTAEDWQSQLVKKLGDQNVTFLNPRRDKWDSTWKQEIENPFFVEQVEWELSALEKADIIFMYFDPNTKSPISLLELGLFAKSSKLIVCCQPGFWRRGNVDVVCKRYGVVQVDTLEQGSELILNMIGK